MRLLFLVDRAGERGGAWSHLLQVMEALAQSNRVTLAFGAGSWRPTGALAAVQGVKIRGLAAAVEDGRGLDGLAALLAGHDVHHLQNLMNPAAIRAVVAAGRAVATVQDHRVFCPGPGRTLPDGAACARAFSEAACAGCLPEADYRARLVAVTAARRDALRGARLIVLSRYMAEELAAAGLPGAQVLPPWVSVGPPRTEAGRGFLIGGRLVAHKGPDLGWRAWAERGAGAAGHPLQVAGAGRLGAGLAGATPLGWLGPAALRAALRSARALLFTPRWQEPFGILGLEALAEGTPVIAADVGGVKDWAMAGVSLVKSGDIKAIGSFINDLIKDDRSALALGEAGRQAVSERFSRDRLLPRLLALYAGIA